MNFPVCYTHRKLLIFFGFHNMLTEKYKKRTEKLHNFSVHDNTHMEKYYARTEKLQLFYGFLQNA